jgi:anaerobic magnesium-protoporphyrin IX monomethyl ester cyclase
MSRRVTFVLPDFPHFEGEYGGTFAHGIGSMTAVLRESGHQVSLVHLVRPPSRRDLLSRLLATSPQVIGFSSITHFFPFVREWIGWARSQSNAPIIVGGIHAILEPEDVMKVPGVDHVCTGEGEYTLLELCERLDRGAPASDVAGTWSRLEDGGVRKNPSRPLIESLDDLPFPDYSIFDAANLYDRRHHRLPVMVSRGCPYRCSYCANAEIRSRYPNPRHYARFLSPERAILHLERLIASHPGTASLVFNDNILFNSRQWLEDFTSLYRERIGLPFTANMRPGLPTAFAARRLADAGCERVCFGVESGDETIANTVLRRDLTNASVERAFRDFQAAGIQTVSYNILGSPFETRETMLRSIRFNAVLHPSTLSAFLFYPFPGTEAHRLCARNGFLNGRIGRHNGDVVMIHQPTVRDMDVLFTQRFFRHLVRAYERAGRLPRSIGVPLERAMDLALGSRWFPRRACLAAKAAIGAARRAAHGWTT